MKQAVERFFSFDHENESIFNKPLQGNGGCCCVSNNFIEGLHLICCCYVLSFSELVWEDFTH